jgi:putative endonuclease
MFYTYILQSQKDFKLYTGFTKDLDLRFEQHQKGKVESTRNRVPFRLIYYEACLMKEDAIKREKYLKTHYGKLFLRNRLKNWYTSNK